MIAAEERRRMAVTLAEGGMNQGRIAAKLGVSRQAVSRWLRTYAIQGAEGLATKPRAGRPSKLTAEQRTELRNELAMTTPMSVVEVRALVAARYGVVYHAHHMGRVIRNVMKEAA